MILWLSLLIPVVTLALIAKVTGKAPPIGFIMCLLGFSFATVMSLRGAGEWTSTRDIEYWGNIVQRAEEDEAWNEKVSCSHAIYRTEFYSCGTAKQPSTCTRQVLVGYEHSFDVKEHPPEWRLVDGSGGELRTTQQRFQELCRLFSNRQRVELGRNYYTRDGDRFVTNWDEKQETIVPLVTTHTYVNRIPASDSIFKFPDITPIEVKRKGLFEYPDVDSNYYVPSVLGAPSTLKNLSRSLRDLDAVNATLGPRKQVRIWVLIFVDKPLQTGVDQQSYWQGGNKNELVVCIGLNKKHEVQWCYPFSWTEVESLKVGARSKVMEQRGRVLDLVPVAAWLRTNIQESWVRKPFADFSYLTIPTPAWAVIAAYVLIVLASAGCWYALTEERR